ncbi:heme ABC transporter ATP-binding protein [Leptospira levettii]|uniref:ABC-type hemin transport system, ATPase n=1 Tax=Leptospira ellinghausenii TaxID=1917822 RepID=A0A2P2DA67_9LEPT|nr:MULTISPECIES: heme ABC transporter ATP-binding protein [Leptospira]MCW7475494.1 heme ABC transporter ATP-binding protein [Leptospira levettii]PJZ35627.1 heme ABC transporter ATP-binding protein [Leptospira levettii]PJZ88194.1 heme ABC transporter ATP-binding protein [Leptospira levettii]PKA00723.1 heme ABC transporter ATP-binding protein [Leptospira levettii]TGK92534.1 heme ABC transporter ATP-binding protein [Leptospira levettii]
MTLIGKNISYQIGKKPILEGINIEIKPGELHVLIGRNGAGKSTLFHLLCGDTKLQSGKVYCNEVEIESFTKIELAKTRAVLTQDAQINFPIPSEQIIALGRYPHVADKTKDSEIVETCLKITNSTMLRQQHYPTLSGGEKQKINFGRILAQVWETPPRYIFLDEPVSAQDIPNQYQTLNICRHMADKGYAVFMILHDLNLASQYADRVTLIDKGKLIQSGSVEEVLTTKNIEIAFGIKTKILKTNEINFIIPEIIGGPI